MLSDVEQAHVHVLVEVLSQYFTMAVEGSTTIFKTKFTKDDGEQGLNEVCEFLSVALKEKYAKAFSEIWNKGRAVHDVELAYLTKAMKNG